MGKVVQFEDPSAGDRGARQRRRSRRDGRSALVLGGGGFTGGVYEIGALRALDLLATNRTVNDFDIYIGTSAGSFVASMLANGVTPEEMMRVLNKGLPVADPLSVPLEDPTLRTLLRPNYRGLVESVVKLPLRVAGTLWHLAGNLGEVSMVDFATGIAEALPNGIYHNRGIEEYMRKGLSAPERSNDFRELSADLRLVATDLDTTERIVFGEGEWADVPISEAVAASGALPLVYEPYEFRGRELVDGGIVSTTNVDLAVEMGAKFIVVINPLVPFVNDLSKEIPTLLGSRVRRISDMGMPGIGNQAFRLLAHARLHVAVESWRERFRDVDIVLIEPEFDDELMFGTSILDYSARLRIAKHGFESVTDRLGREYEHLERLAAKRGVTISGERVRRVLETVDEERKGISAWRRVLEQTTGALLRQSGQAEAKAEAAKSR